MSRRTSTLVAAVLLVVVVVGVGTLVRVPFVAMGPGPTYDTLGALDGTEVVAVTGAETYPTAGHLNMTTVAVNDGVTALTALGFWLQSDRRLVPRDSVYPPGRSTEEVDRQNSEQFAASETSAEAAALAELGLPTRATVAEVVPGSAADGVLREGDTIVSVGGIVVSTPEQLAGSLTGTSAGQSVEVVYERDGVRSTVPVVLGQGDGRGMLGVRGGVEPVTGDITISLGDVGGPSAGLMFALAVVDKMTPGELNGGRFVAGTGTIDGAGTVGPIGGIPFKMIAAKDAGATVFLVPADNCAEAAANAPDGLQLIRVSTLAGAVDALEGLDSGATVPSCTP